MQFFKWAEDIQVSERSNVFVHRKLPTMRFHNPLTPECLKRTGIGECW
jgi:hypothetical protein